MAMRLERWIQYGDCLVGYIYESKDHDPGSRVRTEFIRFLDPINFEAECLDGKYKLGEPGTFAEHSGPMVGQESILYTGAT